ncbi:MAG: phosphoserine phosphatase SerB [Erythrobacter sp.]
MLIARLIADRSDLLTRIEGLKHTLDAEGLPVTVSASEIDGAVLLEVQTMGGSARVLSEALDAVFPDADRLVVSGEEITTPKLFVSDMDSTMIEQECIDELADFAGLKDRVADITERAMQGELDFAEALHERVRLLGGLIEGAITTCLTERITAMPGARTLVQTLRAKGCRTVLVTGGFHHFADAVAEQLGFERVVGNRLEVASGKLTGRLVGVITDSSVKRIVLEEEQGALPAGSTSLATGDGANDIPMLKAADYGFAYHAKPKARAAANGRVDKGDLTQVLHLLGIPQNDWILD